jgi:hypothetical protein
VAVALAAATAVTWPMVGLTAGAGTAPAPATVQPAWWTPNAGFTITPPPPTAQSGPPHSSFDKGLTGWTLDGPGKVDVRVDGVARRRYLAIRDNTTVLSASWRVPPTAQVLTLDARSRHGTEEVDVDARLPDGRTILLGRVRPTKGWGWEAVNARAVAGRTIRLVLDPAMGFGDGVDLSRVGRPAQPAPGFTLATGGARRALGGPQGFSLDTSPGPFNLLGGRVHIPGDAQTVSVWTKAVAGATPVVRLWAGGQLLGETTAGPVWTALRIPAQSLRGTTQRLRVTCPDGTGLALTLVGTVQRSAGLRIAKVTPQPQRKAKIVVAAANALAGTRIALDQAQPAGWAQWRTTLAGPDARATFVVPLGKARVVRARFAGSESVAAGASAPRQLRAAPHTGP